MAFQPMTFDNLGFAIDRLHQDTHPYQYLRELVQNSIEAGATNIRVSPHWETLIQQEKDGVPLTWKLAVYDNGKGMTKDDMRKYINTLFSSGKKQGISDNFGIGAKITALASSPAGVYYFSWVNGNGTVCLLRRNEQGNYGLESINDGEHFAPVHPSFKPSFIDLHGTVVVLLGETEGESLDPWPSHKLSNYLDKRYFRLPQGVTIQATYIKRQDQVDFESFSNIAGYHKGEAGFSPSAYYHSIKGYNPTPQTCKVLHGHVSTSKGKILWYIGDKPLKNNSLQINGCGAIWRNETYDWHVGISASNRMGLFGIVALHHHICIFIEPDDNLCKSDTARAHLQIENREINWHWWGQQFKLNMPNEILEAMEKKIAEYEKEDGKDVDKFIKEIMNKLHLNQRFSLTYKGTLFASGAAFGGTQEQAENPIGPGCKGPGTGGVNRSMFKSMIDNNGEQSKRISNYTNVPSVLWLTTNEWIERYGKEKLDRGADYTSVDNTRMLTLHKGYSWFVKLESIVAETLQINGDVRHRGVLRDSVKRAIVRLLLEYVVINEMHLQTPRIKEYWNLQDRDILFTQEALSAVCHRLGEFEAQIVKEVRKKIKRIPGHVDSQVEEGAS